MNDFEESTSHVPEDGPDFPQSEQPVPASPYASSPFTGYYDTHEAAPSKKSGKHRKHRAFPWKGIGICLLALACLGTGLALGNRFSARQQKQLDSLQSQLASLQSQLDGIGSGSPAVFTPLPAGEVMTPAQVYARNVNSVVGIKGEGTTTIGGQSIASAFSGSGFILTEDGFVVTNNHVVEQASSISVITQAGKTYEAELIGRDTTADMALLKIEETGLPPVTLGSSTQLAIGDMVVAIGNPLSALEATQTVGYISGKNREVSADNSSVVNMLQTDAAINSGNSGGPLFNMRGEVVGITTAKYSGTSSSGASIEGLSFAIPIDDLKTSIQELQTQGYVSSAYLGIRGMDVESAAVDVYGLPSGAYVESVEPDGAAKAAGIQPKDIITAVGDQSVTGINSLARILRSFRAGDKTTVTVYRGGQELTLDVTLSERPRDDSVDTGDDLPSSGSYDEWYDYFSKFFDQAP